MDLEGADELNTLMPLAEVVAERLKKANQTVSVVESASGGLISAALLSIPGAGSYFVGGAVTYSSHARIHLLSLARWEAEMRAATESYAYLLARTVQLKLGTTWGLSETGAAGPGGNRYGDLAGHSCMSVVGPIEAVCTIETASEDRASNMVAFAARALELLGMALEHPSS